MPDILFSVGGEDSAVVGDEVGCVVENWVFGLGVGIRIRIFTGESVVFDDCTRDDADVELFGEGLVGLEVFGGYLGVGLGEVKGVCGWEGV